jgi:hypothetical protein
MVNSSRVNGSSRTGRRTFPVPRFATPTPVTVRTRPRPSAAREGGGTDVLVDHEPVPDADDETGVRIALAGLAALVEAGEHPR